MKAITYLLLLIIVGLAAAPWGVGVVVEKRYRQMLDQISKVYGDNVQMQVEYERGYLKSVAKTSITDPVSGQTFSFVDTIQNGPVILDFQGVANPASYIPRGFKLAIIDSKLQGLFEESIKAVYGGKEAYKVTTVLEYSGNGETTIKIFPLQMNNGPNDSVDWQGGEYKIKFDPEFVKFSGSMNFPKLEYSDGINKVIVSQITGGFENNINTNEGEYNFGIADIIVSDHNSSDKISIKGVNFNGKADVKDKMMTANMQYGTKSVDYIGDMYGPIGFNITFSNINNDLFNEISKGGEQGVNMDPQLLEFFQQRPTMDFTLEAVTPQGDISVAIRAEVGNANLTELTEEGLMETSNITADIRIAKELIRLGLSEYVASEISMQEAIYFMQNRENPNAAPNPYVMTAAELQQFTDEWIGTFTQYMLDDKFWLEAGEQYTTNIKFVNNEISFNDTVKTHTDLEYLGASLNIIIASEPATAPDNTKQDNNDHQQQPSAPVDAIPEPPSELQPMTEEEAEQRLDAVQIPAGI